MSPFPLLFASNRPGFRPNALTGRWVAKFIIFYFFLTVAFLTQNSREVRAINRERRTSMRMGKKKVGHLHLLLHLHHLHLHHLHLHHMHLPLRPGGGPPPLPLAPLHLLPRGGGDPPPSSDSSSGVLPLTGEEGGGGAPALPSAHPIPHGGGGGGGGGCDPGGGAGHHLPHHAEEREQGG